MAQTPSRDRDRFGAIGAGRGVRFHHRQPVHFGGEAVGQRVPSARDRQDVRAGRPLQQRGFLRQREQQRQERFGFAVVRRGGGRAGKVLEQAGHFVFQRFGIRPLGAHGAHQHRLRDQLLRGVPAGETVAVAQRQLPQRRRRALIARSHRRRETAQETHLGVRRHGLEHQISVRFGEVNDEGAVAARILHPGGRLHRHLRAVRLAGGTEQLAAFRIQQAQRERDVERQLVRLPGRRIAGLRDGEAQGAVLPLLLHREQRRAGLLVPAPELRQRRVRGVLQGAHEVLGGHRAAVVPLEVQIRAGAEGARAEDGVQHPHHFGALLVHRGGVEVADLLIAGRAHRMRERPGVLGELHGAQQIHVVHALDAARVHVRGELGVAVHREALFQAELKPIAAGDAVAGPVVEVLVRHHRLHALVGGVRGGVGAGQHAGGVEDVEALVLHRPHVEVLDGDDHEDVQVVLAAEPLLVPAHGALERLHRVAALADVVRFGEDAQRHAAAGAGDELVLAHRQIAGHQGEQVAGFGERVLPSHGAAAVRRALGNQVAVGEQHRMALGVRGDGGGVAREHVRAIRVVGDLAKALRLALRAIHAARLVEALQGGVLLRGDVHLGANLAVVGDVEQRQGRVVLGVLVAGQRPSIHPNPAQIEPFAAQHQRPVAGAAYRELAADGGRSVLDVEGEPRLVDRERIRLIVAQIHRAWGVRHALLRVLTSRQRTRC